MYLQLSETLWMTHTIIFALSRDELSAFQDSFTHSKHVYNHSSISNDGLNPVYKHLVWLDLNSYFTVGLEEEKLFATLTYGVLFPNLLQKVILTLFLCPVLWSNVWHVWKGGLYKCKLTAHSVWLTFSTRWRPMESETNGSTHYSIAPNHCDGIIQIWLNLCAFTLSLLPLMYAHWFSSKICWDFWTIPPCCFWSGHSNKVSFSCPWRSFRKQWESVWSWMLLRWYQTQTNSKTK